MHQARKISALPYIATILRHRIILPLQLVTLTLLILSGNSQANTILVLGDSLSASYGIDADKGWVNLMQQELGSGHSVLNASISGETTQGGLARLPALLAKYQPNWLILELGGNDGLQGQSLQRMRDNLQKMIDLAHQANTRVLLIGNHIPPNYGRIYTERFFRTYAELAQANQIPLVPFMLEQVGTRPELMQQDGLHPNSDGQPQVLENIRRVLYPLIDQHSLIETQAAQGSASP